MKYLIIILALTAFVAKAQESKFEAAILKGKQLLKEAEGEEEYLSAFNFFERIAQKETEEWLPLYYQAQSLAMLGANLSERDKKEETLNKALDIVIKAKKLDKNAEVVALEGFVQMIRLTVDPGTRGQILSPTIFGLFNESLAINPENPRALLFLGQMHHGTAQFFGSSFEEACKYIQKAYNIFGQQAGESTIYPEWGMESAEFMLEKCNGSN